MINKILFGVSFAAIGALTYGWWVNHERIMAAQQAQIEKFMSAGPRFTAQDGQALCERIQKLEPKPQPCRYAGKNPLSGDDLH